MASIHAPVTVPPAVTGQGGVAATGMAPIGVSSMAVAIAVEVGVWLAGTGSSAISSGAVSGGSTLPDGLAVLTVVAATPSPVTVSRAMAESMAAKEAFWVEGIRASEPRAGGVGDAGAARRRLAVTGTGTGSAGDLQHVLGHIGQLGPTAGADRRSGGGVESARRHRVRLHQRRRPEPKRRDR